VLNNSWIALLVTLVIAFVWLRLIDFLAHKGLISSAHSRKIIHIGTGPIFVLCWIFFPDEKLSPFLAALVPLIITLQFALVGFGVIPDKATVDSMSRTGDRREILRGPLFYGVVFILLTIIFWRKTPVGIVALMILCGGDGIADIIGKRFGKLKIPWSQEKTLAGSLSMVIGGFLLASFILWIFVLKGFFVGPMVRYLLPISVIVLVATVIESLPFKDIDNLSIPFISVILGLILLN
jgi:phytol kinase